MRWRRAIRPSGASQRLMCTFPTKASRLRVMNKLDPHEKRRESKRERERERCLLRGQLSFALISDILYGHIRSAVLAAQLRSDELEGQHSSMTDASSTCSTAASCRSPAAYPAFFERFFLARPHQENDTQLRLSHLNPAHSFFGRLFTYLSKMLDHHFHRSV